MRFFKSKKATSATNGQGSFPVSGTALDSNNNNTSTSSTSAPPGTYINGAPAQSSPQSRLPASQPGQTPYMGPVIATMFFRVREGVNMGELIYNPATATGYKAQSFHEMNRVLSAEPAVLAHYWGHQVEDPTVVVYVIEWASAQAIDMFTQTPGHETFAAGVEELYDLDNHSSFVVEARFRGPATTAFDAPVTKMSFFTAPYSVGEHGKQDIERSLEPLALSATTVGQSTGMAFGWAQWIDDFEPGVIPKEHILQMVSGYASLDDHVRWTQTDGYRHVGSIMQRLASDGFTSRSVYGRSIFSVRFTRGDMKNEAY